jgi:hypothetical protein
MNRVKFLESAWVRRKFWQDKGLQKKREVGLSVIEPDWFRLSRLEAGVENPDEKRARARAREPPEWGTSSGRSD